METKKTYTWSYLQSAEADPLFETVADNIKKYNCKRILDFACGYSRINEFLTDYACSVDGLDSDEDCIEYCKETYTGNYVTCDALAFESCEDLDDSYDCVVVSGFFYYTNRPNWPTMLELFDRIKERFNPKIIIVTDPQPRKDYNSPDYSDLLLRYAYTVEPLYLDIRMGQRNVYTFFADRTRPDFKIKAKFNQDSIHDHWQADEFDENTLKHCVYLTNTETIDHERDGRVFPVDQEIERYISVAAGLKGMYKAALDWYPGKQFEFVYVDIVPLALDYRMYMDRTIGFTSPNDIYNQYVETVNDNIVAKFGGDIVDINSVVKNQIKELGLEECWSDFLEAYANAPKTYIRLDAINNVKLFNSIIQDRSKKTWFWYSNAPDWHQFRLSEHTWERWIKYLNDRNNAVFVGKTPPFTSS